MTAYLNKIPPPNSEMAGFDLSPAEQIIMDTTRMNPKNVLFEKGLPA